MTYFTYPIQQLSGSPFRACVPGSKSFTNRALIIASQRMGKTVIRHALHSDDTDRLASSLGSFVGLSVAKTSDGYIVNRDRVRLGAPAKPIFINGAGTPARFLLGFAAMAEGETLVTGNARLSERPMADILRSFDAMGVAYRCEGRTDSLPVRVTGSTPQTDHWTVSGEISSQFTSSLLLLAAQQEPGRRITVDVSGRQVSRPYVEMTLQMLRTCGIAAELNGDQSFVVTAAQPASPVIEIEPDASGMSYMLAAAAVTGTSVIVSGMPENTAQGDVGFARLLGRMGCAVSFGPEGLTLGSSGRLTGIEADMDSMPDTVLTLAVVAAFAAGPTRITNVANLRFKECDRLSAAAHELRRLGVEVEEGPDWIEVKPGGKLKPASIHTYDDHRVAMAFSIVGLISEGVAIEEPDCVTKSFPTYWEEFERFRSHHKACAA